MRKLSLKISSHSQRDVSWVHKLDEIKGIQRKFYLLQVELKWQNHQTEIQALIEISRCLGCHLRKFSISSACFLNSKDFCNVLENMVMLKNLQLNYTRFEAEEICPHQKFSMKYLEDIKLSNSSWKFLQFFNASQLKSIEISFGNHVERAHLIQFLEFSNNLESFAIDATAFNVIFSEKITETLSFKLKKLLILSKFSCKQSKLIDQNFHSFLGSQKTLEELRFGDFCYEIRTRH